MIRNKITAPINNLSGVGFFGGIISLLINAAFIVAVIYFFFNLVLGGINWIGSGGDKTKLEESRSRVSNAIVGIFVTFLAYVLFNLVGSVFNINIMQFNLEDIRLK